MATRQTGEVLSSTCALRQVVGLGLAANDDQRHLHPHRPDLLEPQQAILQQLHFRVSPDPAAKLVHADARHAAQPEGGLDLVSEPTR